MHAALFIFGIALIGCQGGGGDSAGSSPALDPLPTGCPEFQAGEVIGTVEYSEITEASGLAASPGGEILWVHNDSGDRPRLFALDLDGALRGVFELEGAEAEDWEDLAIGPGPVAGVNYIYVGDSGSGGDPPWTIYRLEEPTGASREIADWEAFQLTLPGGEDLDAETLLVDPETADLYVVTKTGDESFLFKKSAPHQDGERVEMEEVAVLDLSIVPGNRQTTGGDIRSDGRLVVVRTYSHALVWERSSNEDLATALLREPCQILELASEPQGEAIAFTSEGDLLTTSEKTNQPIYRYAK